MWNFLYGLELIGALSILLVMYCVYTFPLQHNNSLTWIECVFCFAILRPSDIKMCFILWSSHHQFLGQPCHNLKSSSVCRVRMSGWICGHWWDGSVVTWAPWAEKAWNCGMSLMKNSAATWPVPLTHAERLILRTRRSVWPTFPRLPFCRVGWGGR